MRCRVVRVPTTRPSRTPASPRVAHSGQQHLDGQLPMVLARVPADVYAREHDIRPVDVATVK